MSSELGCSVFRSSPGWVDIGGWNASSLWTDPDQDRQRETLNDESKTGSDGS